MPANLAFVIEGEGRSAEPLRDAPHLSAAVCDLLREVWVVDEAGGRRPLHVPVERPLTVFIDDREIVTLMTIGAAPELLVLGFVLNQGLIGRAAELESIDVDWSRGSARVARRAAPAQRGATADAGALTERSVPTACSQGSVYGELMNRVDAIRLPDVATARLDRATLLHMLDTMRRHDAIHRSAGSVHSCALFQNGELLVAVEDVSRHNGLDTVSGWMAQHGIDGGDKILFTTGRLTAEMVMKAAQRRVPIMLSRNGVSGLGIDLATQLGITLFGRASGQRFTCYVGGERFDAAPAA